MTKSEKNPNHRLLSLTPRFSEVAERTEVGSTVLTVSLPDTE
jgi:hypothetical protein